jgi:(1->4)-alpha-D-glucan 1-alpha-D-glucosylmutase
MRIPAATYRIQFTPAFGFRSAAQRIPYLSGLGISDVYASPVFKARKGSTHGYDVVDPRQLNPELGSPANFETFVRTLAARGMGLLQDIVPNHMSFSSDNGMLMDVLEMGRHSPYYRLFDIDWDHPYESMKGKLLAPLLGRFFAEALEEGEIQLRFGERGLCIAYYDLTLPVRIESYLDVLGYNISGLEQRFCTENAACTNYLGLINLFKSFKLAGSGNVRVEQIVFAKKMLLRLYAAHTEIKRCVDENIAYFNGRKGVPESFNALDKLLSEQLFRLSFWKVATEEINYRRFFTINELISLKVEDEEMFKLTHGLIIRLAREGAFTGLRVDHIDGLYDPAAYLSRLREQAPQAYIVVEKILERGERLPPAWPVQGTTGYDFLTHANGVFCHTGNEREFSKVYEDFIGQHVSYDELVCQKKRLIIGKHLAGNIDNLAQLLKKVSGKDKYGRDITLYALKRALVEVMTFFSVYRTYVSQETMSDSDREYIKEAILKARESLPALAYELKFIVKFMLLKYDPSMADDMKKEWTAFIMNFQQYTGPLMAKGYEDTIFYVYNRLISLNEVGGDPSRFGVSADDFHAFQRDRAASWPHALNATSTHDTKRGEDVRARVNVLSELPREWKAHARLWRQINKKHKTELRSGAAPDKNDEYFIYQTLVGAFPFDAARSGEFTGRMKAYIVKVVREAKVHTEWIKPDREYEDACVSFVENILAPSADNGFLRDFRSFQKKIAYYGIFNSLSQTLLKITCPGVPDFYQGTELWELCLVDPDNRGGIDFPARESALRGLKEATVEELMSRPQDGRIKLFLITRALSARKKYPDVFQKGRYVPLRVEGEHKNSVIAFARRYEDQWALTVVPRFLTGLVQENELPLGTDVWKDARILMPKKVPAWADVFTGKRRKGLSAVPVGELLSAFPVSLLLSKK